MRRSRFIVSLGGATFLHACGSGTQGLGTPGLVPNASSGSSNAGAGTTRAFAITGYDRDRTISSTVLSFDTINDSLITTLAMPYTGGRSITMNRRGTCVYASQIPAAISGKGTGPFPLIHRLSQSPLAIVETYFLPAASCTAPVDLWEIALDGNEANLWIAYGQNGMLRLAIGNGSVQSFPVNTSNGAFECRCVSVGAEVVYVAGATVSGTTGMLLSLNPISGSTLSSIALPNGIRANYSILSDDRSTLYIGGDTAAGISYALVYDAATLSLLHQQNFSGPPGMGAGEMAVNPIDGWVALGYQIYEGVQYLPSTGFFDVLHFNFDGSGLAFTEDGAKLYASYALQSQLNGLAHVAVYKLGTENGSTEWISNTEIPSPNLFNEHVLSITMN
jgi:hypothetical protein